MKLEDLGWNSSWARALASSCANAATVARIVMEHRGAFDAEAEDGLLRLTLLGTCPAQPFVGDWVLIDRQNARITAVLPRQSQIARKEPGGRSREQVLAANVDVAVLVMGLDADFNLRRLERYLVLVQESGARPLVLLNKADLGVEVAAKTDEVLRIVRTAPVLALSALRDDVGKALTPFLAPGESIALLGSSGAGKSTLLNAILGGQCQRTAAVRESDQRGRHTTTARHLISTPQGWLIFDLPGLRELQLWAGKQSLESTFEEIGELATQCRFRDCRHQGEPGCAVEAAVDSERLASYQRLGRELQSLEERRSGPGYSNSKHRWKAIHKAMRHHPKYNR